MEMFALKTLDPRAKMLILICISTLAMITSDLKALTILLMVTILIPIAGKVNFFELLWQAKMAVGFIVFIFIIQCLFVRTGIPLVTIKAFTLITYDGLSLACLLSLRLLILIISAIIILTGEPRDYLLAFAQCKVPYEIAFMVMVAIHFFPILREEALNVFYSVQLRGTEIKNASLKKRAQVYIKICLPILVGALEKARVMSIAMEARCFRLFPYRTYMRRLVLKKRDKVSITVTLIVAVLFVGMVFIPPVYATEISMPDVMDDVKPYGIVLSWTEDNRNTQTVTWSAGKGEEFIQYLDEGTYQKNDGFKTSSQIMSVKAKRIEIYENKYYRYEATMRNLAQGSTYYYRVGSADVWSEAYHFTTAPQNADSAQFMFMGDAQAEVRDIDYPIWGGFLKEAYTANPNTAFVVMGGDLVESSGNTKDWDGFLKEGESVFSKIPLMPTPGNHETSILPAVYLKMFALLENGLTEAPEEFYSFDYGDCHIVSLNSAVFMSERERYMGSQKWQELIQKTVGWLKSDLMDSDAKWKIVIMHHPAYPINEDDVLYDLIRSNWVPVLNEAQVDLVLCGHQHTYMRTKELSGVIYMMGVSGEKRTHYYQEPLPEYVQKISIEGGNYQIVNATDKSLTVTSYNREHQEIDKIALMPKTRIDKKPWHNALYAYLQCVLPS